MKVLIPGPDQTSEKPSARSTLLPPRAFAVDEALPFRGDLRLGHACLDDELAVVHRCRRDVVREAHAVDLLLGLERTGFGDEWRRVGDVTERGEPLGRERGRLANHAVCGLRPERELEPHPSVRARRGARELEHAGNRRPRIRRVVPCEEEDVVGPGRADCVVLARLEAHERRLALEREDARVVALHAPEVRQVEDVVRRADDERVELALVHERTHAVELRVVARPRHVPSVYAPSTR